MRRNQISATDPGFDNYDTSFFCLAMCRAKRDVVVVAENMPSALTYLLSLPPYVLVHFCPSACSQFRLIIIMTGLTCPSCKTGESCS